MRQAIRRLIASANNFGTKYPAVLSGLIIYAYLLYTIIHFLVRAKSYNPTFFEVLEAFDALPFMWLLSLALVKIISVRALLHESETHRLLAEKQIELKQTQLTTLHEVVKSLQHHINNPLAIISLTLGPARRHAKDNPDLARQLDTIDDSVQRIVKSLKDFFSSQSYETQRIDPVVGSITALPETDRPHSPSTESTA